MAEKKAAFDRKMPVEFKNIPPPCLDEIRMVLEAGLKKNYEEAAVEIVDCPDLTQEPFKLAAKGICGGTALADVGGVPYLCPGPAQWRERVYNLDHTASQVETPGGLIIGAGAASKHDVGVNAELIMNIRTSGGEEERKNETHVARVDPADEKKALLLHYEKDLKSADFTLLGNLFISKGEGGKVLKVTAKKRIGNEGSIVTCMRKTLEEGFKLPVGMGGTFLQVAGEVKYHVMPDFSPCPLDSDEKVSQWLRFYTFGAPFVNMATFISKDPGLDLRVEHTHGYSTVNGTGGHYHYDVTPDTIEYLGYFSPAKKIYRIDRPEETHMIGRD